MSDVDSAKLVHAVLLLDAPLVAETTNVVGDEVVSDIYGPPGLPTDWSIRKGLFFLGGGGPGDEQIPIARETFDFYCYGDDAKEARAVFIKLRRCLHRRAHTRITIDSEVYILQYSQLLSGPQDRTDPTEGWNVVYCSFMIQFVETTVP